jgi:predicted phosphodiesterase
MSELIEQLVELSKPGNQPEQIRKNTPSAPNGWEPGVKYEPDGRMTVTTPIVPPADNPDAWKELIEGLGQKVPDGWRVVLKEAKYDPAAWQRDEQGQDAITKPIWRYRFVIEPCVASISTEDLVAVLKKKRPSAFEKDGYPNHAFTVVAADMQWGKSDKGGSVVALENWLRSTDLALARYKAELKRKRVSECVIILPGDCIEGTQSGANRLNRLDLTLTEQVRIYRRTLLDLVERFALVGPPVTVIVVPGNHDEAIRSGNELNTTYDDSWAIEGASQVADTLAKCGFDNVGFVFPQHDTLTVCVDVCGTVLGVMHGHQMRGKMQDWLAKQALGRQPIGTADLVISGHFHHLVVQQLGPTAWLQAPALESGSQWFENATGLSAPKGMVTLIVGEGSWNSLEVC